MSMEPNRWVKSSLSNNSCVEVQWRKSSFSSPNGCVETAPIADGVLVRNSRYPDGAVLKFTYHEWDVFLKGARNNEFDVAEDTQ